MATPIFLEVAQILRLHDEMIAYYGGMSGVRDIGLLHSAIATPRAYFKEAYLHTDIYEMAAAYMYHIVNNHPFLDGNKRTGAAAALIFLMLNDITIEPDEEGLVALTLSVARGKSSKNSIAVFFRQRSKIYRTDHNF